jgi:hypothetical protein
VTPAELRDAPVLAFLPARLQPLRGGRVFVLAGVLPKRGVEVIEAECVEETDADALLVDGDAA